MPLTKFDEVPDARENLEHPPAITTRYLAVGLDQATGVEMAVLGGGLLAAQIVHALHGILYRQPIRVVRIGYNVHEVHVEWAQRKWAPLERTWRGRTTGGTQKIIGSLATVASSENAPDFNKLIGVNADGTVEGTEVIVPALQLSIDTVYPLGFVDLFRMKLWSYNTGKTNAAPFEGWQIGEVLYEGTEFEDGTNSPTRVTHNVSISPNLTNVTIAGLTGINKKGWEFLWFRVVEETNVAGGITYPVKRATHYYVEQIYQTVDLATIFGFG